MITKKAPASPVESVVRPRLRDCESQAFARRLLKSLRSTLDGCGGESYSDILFVLDKVRSEQAAEESRNYKYGRHVTENCL